MAETLTVACVQTTSGPDVDANIAAVAPMVRAARDSGAELITLPEVVNLLETKRRIVLAAAVAEEHDRAHGPTSWLVKNSFSGG